MSTPHYFDVHTHTHFAAFGGETDVVIERAREAGVWLVNVGTQRDTSAGALTVAERYKEGVYATVGLHPIHTEKSHHDTQELGEGGAQFTSRGEEFDFDVYKKMAEHPTCVAIGECGLDYYRLSIETKRRQAQIFVRHIELAAAVEKPLMIHCRDAFADLIVILKEHAHLLRRRDSGIIHFFTGSVDEARVLCELGFSFSFGGVITFTPGYHDALKSVPLERIVSETDAPYVAPVPYRGKRNEPLYVREVARAIADIRGEDFQTVREQLVLNARRVFGL